MRAHGDGQRVHAHRAAAELDDDSLKDAFIHFVQTVLVNLEHRQGAVGLFERPGAGHPHQLLFLAGLQQPVLQQLVAQARPQVGIEAGEGFVEQQQVGSRGQRTGQGHALLLAARELVRQAAFEAGKAEARQQSGHPGLALRPRPAREPEADVSGHREVGEEGEVLEDEAEAALLRRQAAGIGPAQPHLPGRRGVQAGDHPQQGGLATARGAEQGAEAAARQGEAHVPEHALAAMGGGQRFDLEQGVCHQRIWRATKSQFTRFQKASTYLARALR